MALPPDVRIVFAAVAASGLGVATAAVSAIIPSVIFVPAKTRRLIMIVRHATWAAVVAGVLVFASCAKSKRSGVEITTGGTIRASSTSKDSNVATPKEAADSKL